MSYKASEIRWYKEDTPGVIPADPENYLIATAEAYSLAQNYPTETIQTLGAGGEASPKIEGTPSYEGSLTLVLTSDLFPLILIHGIGDATMTDPHVGPWQADTAVVEGEYYSHSDGVHTLYCKVAGTTGSTEPDLTTADEYDEIDDNGVIWIVRDLMGKYTGSRSDCLSTFGIEMMFTGGGCGQPVEFIRERFGGCRINTLSFGKSGDDTGFRSEVGIVAMSGDDDQSNPNYPDQGGVDIPLSKRFLGTCDLEVFIDDVKVVNTTSVSVDINRNITTDKGVNCGDNVTQIGVIDIPGTITCLMDKETYLRSADRQVHNLKLVYTDNGDTCIIEFPQVKFDRVAPTVDPTRFVTLDSTFSAFGDSATPSVQYTIITDIRYGI